MRPICPVPAVVNETKRILTSLLVVSAIMLLTHDARATTNVTTVLHFTFRSVMTNTAVEANARGIVTGNLDHKENASSLRLNISLSRLNSNAVYLLVAYIGTDTNSTTVAEFATTSKGAFKINYVKKARTDATPGGEPLPEVLSPICTIRELAIVNVGGQTVLRSDLTDPDSLQYHVDNSMTDTGFVPGAVGTLRIDANKHHSHFNLQAVGLTPGAVYRITINGNAAQADTADRKGKLNLKGPLPGATDVLDIHMLALTDSSGTNVVLTTDGLGVPCDTTVPSVSFTFPANAATGAPINGQLAATFSEAMNPATINAASFILKQGTTVVTGTVSYVGITATFAPASSLAPLTNFVATITTAASDLAGNAMAANFVWKFTTGATPDTTPPTVSSTVPSNGTTAVAINQTVAAVFSEAMDPLTINTATFILHQAATPVTGTVSYAGVTATFAPIANLATLTTYTATITTGVTDLARNALTANLAWSFTTGPSIDTTPPTIIATNPTNNTQNVAVNQTVNATFSEAMDPTTVTTAHFTLIGPNATTVTGTFAYVAASEIASFTPATNLLPNTTYTNTITAGVKDLAGNALATNFVWSFTTGAQIDTNLMTIDLGATSTFAILATAAVSGGGDQINGDVGLHRVLPRESRHQKSAGQSM